MEILGTQIPEFNLQIPFALGIAFVVIYYLYRKNLKKQVSNDAIAQIFFLGAILPAAVNLIWAGLFGNFLLDLNETEKVFYTGFGGLLLTITTIHELKRKFTEL